MNRDKNPSRNNAALAAVLNADNLIDGAGVEHEDLGQIDDEGTNTSPGQSRKKRQEWRRMRAAEKSLGGNLIRLPRVSSDWISDVPEVLRIAYETWLHCTGVPQSPTSLARSHRAMQHVVAAAFSGVQQSRVFGTRSAFRGPRGSDQFYVDQREQSSGFTRTYVRRALDFLVESGRATVELGYPGKLSRYSLTQTGLADLGVSRPPPRERLERASLVEIRTQQIMSNGKRRVGPSRRPYEDELERVRETESLLRAVNAQLAKTDIRLLVDLADPTLRAQFTLKRFNTARLPRLRDLTVKLGIPPRYRSTAMQVLATLAGGNHVLAGRILADEEATFDRYLNVDLSRIDRYHSVYNRSSLDVSGRKYSPGVQCLPGFLRRFIVLDGVPAVEIDFQAMHIRMLYQLKGLSFPGDDPYETRLAECLGRPLARALVKLAALMGINAMTLAIAIRAFVSKLNRSAVRLPKGLSCREVLTAFCEAHPLIADCIGSDFGVHLMNLDSQVVKIVHRRCVEAGFAGLSVHDSLIVPLDRVAVVEGWMLEAYAEVMSAAARERGVPVPRGGMSAQLKRSEVPLELRELHLDDHLVDVFL